MRLQTRGVNQVDTGDASTALAELDGVLPDGFYSTTNLDTRVRLDGTWREIASYVPILSTLLMPIRILEGDVTWWEPALALGLVAVFCALTIAVGSRLYQRALLHTSGSLTWRRALRLAE